MQFSITHPYPRDTETVFRILTDPEYLLEKIEYTGARNFSVLECGENDGRFIIRTRREVQANPPAFAKKFIHAWNTVVGTDTWLDYHGKTKTGVSDIDIKGMPIRYTAELALKPTKKGCNYVIACDISVRIPLIGGKIEKLAEADTRANQALDYEFTRRYLENL